jgi:H+-translocating NAD(P) transhydrogenase subunit alpha
MWSSAVKDLLLMVSVFVGAFVIGYFLVSRVPARLHTPLMSMTNAISAVTILGGILLFAVELNVVQKVLGFLAIALAAFNVVGGFVITDRMLKMFHKHHD